MSDRVMTRGTWLAGDHGTADGPITSQLPLSRGASIVSHPSCVEPLGPECPSCMPIFAGVSAWTKSTIRFHSRSCSGA